MTTLLRLLIVTCVCLFTSGIAAAADGVHILLVEAESFENLGGWVVDQQFMDQMGSPILLAHGLGVPVADATTKLVVPAAGRYRVLVRTRDWTAPWKTAGKAWDAPGKFQVLLGARPLPATFGTEGAEWHWQQGGSVDLAAGAISLALHDLTGFDGRCDAIVLSSDPDFVPPNQGKELAAFRRKALGLPEKAEDAGHFDLVVVGGGMAGTCTALLAARLGLQVALIQDRPLLGGNNSSDVRVHLGGGIHKRPYPALGSIVEEIGPQHDQSNARPAEFYEDGKKLKAVAGEPKIRLFLNMHVNRVEKERGRIVAVDGKHVINGREYRFSAPLFADCTGDATVGWLAGADYRYGRESREQTGESLAPPQADRQTMGASVMWYSLPTDEPAPFPDCPWAVQFNQQTYQHALSGDWDWETGFRWDQVEQIEKIRDHGLRAVYGNWAYQKNHAADRDRYARHKLGWVAYIAGKRESRRLLGDVILCQRDIEEIKHFPDSCVTATWGIDLHYPLRSDYFPGEEFRSKAEFRRTPCVIPYRCFYSRNVPNLFMAGRDISVTHVALGAVRVQRITGMMGEVVGMAASLCKRHHATPSEVYEKYLEELKSLMKGAGEGNAGG